MPRLLVLMAGLLVFAAPALALDLPTRKAGQWELKMVFEGRNLPAQMMRQCVDAAGQPCAVTVTATFIPRKSELAPV